MIAQLKAWLRACWADWLGHREDRYYWRQQTDVVTLPSEARVCLWQPDGKLGDAIVTATLVHSLRVQRPDLKLVVVCDPGLISFWQGLQGVEDALPEDQWMQLKAGVGRSPLHAFVSFETFVSVSTLRALRALQPKVAIGFSVAQYQAFTHSLVDLTYSFPRRHITERLRHVCEVLSLDYLAASDVATCAAAATSELSASLPADRPVVYLNALAAAAHRSFNTQALLWIVAQIQAHSPSALILLNAGDDVRSQLAQQLGMPQVQWMPQTRLSTWQLVHLVSRCDGLISTDTALGHIGAAVNKPLAVFYADKHYNAVVWRPMSAYAQLVLPTEAGDVSRLDHAAAQQAIRAVCSSL